MALPWIIGGAAVVAGKLIYDAVTDESSSSSSSYSDKGEREREAKQRAKEAKNERILEEISEYKDTQFAEIEEKYGVIIDFVSEKDIKSSAESLEDNIGFGGIYGGFGVFGKDEKYKVQISSQNKIKQYKINDFKKESKEIKEAMQELEAIKNETLK